MAVSSRRNARAQLCGVGVSGELVMLSTYSRWPSGETRIVTSTGLTSAASGTAATRSCAARRSAARNVASGPVGSGDTGATASRAPWITRARLCPPVRANRLTRTSAQIHSGRKSSTAVAAASARSLSTSAYGIMIGPTHSATVSLARSGAGSGPADPRLVAGPVPGPATALLAKGRLMTTGKTPRALRVVCVPS